MNASDSAKVKCVNCGNICRNSDLVYQVRIVDCNGQVSYCPACSIECAQETQRKYASIHRERLENVMNQSFQKMTVKNYLYDR